MTLFDVPGDPLIAEPAPSVTRRGDRMAPGLAVAESGAVDTATGQWRLARVELVNWGTFQGHTVIDVARAGHLFTGASGSGKSSLLDAIATALTPAKWLRYNAAAQDASAPGQDRSLVSYLRGAWSKEADDTLDRAVNAYLRTRATWSGILLRMENLRDAPLTLVRLFHLRGASVDKADVKDLAILLREDAGLLDFSEFVASGINTRALKKTWPAATVTTNASHGAYFAKLVRVLGLGSDRALQLLHKTQSAKNLGNLDHLFRTFMLDEPDTFAMADNAVEQFRELNEAHELVVDARDQLEALRALEPTASAFEQATATRSAAEHLRSLLVPFEQRLTLRLVEQELGRARGDLGAARESRDRAAAALTTADEDLEAARRTTSAAGGDRADLLRERMERAEADRRTTEDRWDELERDLCEVGIDRPATAADFEALRGAARDEVARPRDAGSVADERNDSDQQAYTRLTDAIARIDAELGALRRRRSNLPGGLLGVRAELARDLGVVETALPFAGELIDVRPEFVAWTGAIERVLHPLAVTLLVPDEYVTRVRELANTHHLGVRLAFEAVPVRPPAPRRVRSPRSLVHRVAVVEGPLHDWLTGRLVPQFDYECVDDPAELSDVEFGLTASGLTKTGHRRYVKDDRHRIDDRTRWVLGSSNTAKVGALIDEKDGLVARRTEIVERLDAAEEERRAREKRLFVLERIARRDDWDQLDRVAAAAREADLKARLDALVNQDAGLHDAVAAQRAAEARHVEAAHADRKAYAVLTRAEELVTTLTVRRDGLVAEIGTSTMDEDDVAALDARYRRTSRTLTPDLVVVIGRRIQSSLDDDIRAAQSAAGEARAAFAAGAADLRTRWPAQVADLDASIDDRDSYRALRTRIEGRGLPGYEQRFLQLLHDKSQEVVAHLLAELRDAPKLVRDRVEPVNVSLDRSPFDRDRYLHIRVREQRSAEVTEFMADLKSVADGAWGEEGVDAAERRFETLTRIMHDLASSDGRAVAWRRRCLDTREHVTFQAQEVDGTGVVRAVHDSSAGLSGGQRQKLVIFCLAAALRYQLAPDEEDRPVYGTVILDEAFDKADSAYTRMAMDVFVTFGFHMILATPQKLLSTIEPYVGAVTNITNATHQHSRIENVVFVPDGEADGEPGGEPEDA